MPDYMRRHNTDVHMHSRESRQSDESSRYSQSTAPTSVYSNTRPSIHQSHVERSYYYQKNALDLTPYDISPATTYYPRSSQDTYASTSASQEDLFDEPESYDPEYEVPECKEVVESNLRPSNSHDFARFFPSSKRLLIRHDNTSYDGNMNLRVDTETRNGQSKEVVQLFHLRMHDLKKREFSLRRYERSSGREVCHSSRKYAKPAAERRPAALTRSVSNAFASIRKPDFKRTNSTNVNAANPMAGIKRQDSGYVSNEDSDDEIEDFMSDKKAAAAAMIPTNTTKLEFSNYAQIEVRRRGAKSSKRYEFEYWGHSYTWKRVTEKDGEGKAISYHLFKNDGGPAVAHIVPELRSPAQIHSEEVAGSWVPPCQMWISDPKVLKADTDVADVIVSTGLIALVDDSIKRHFDPKVQRIHQLGVPLTPLKMDMEFVGPRAMVEHMFKRRNSGGSTKSKDMLKQSPLRYAQPVGAS
ncbi:Calcofluor white hypersensitive protein [Rutstroemia sp. NJR-2017a WRK4]|nr:Calcofluor white hypersensitive protein [Rutstroemia sp. NJR-2017a WRK4]